MKKYNTIIWDYNGTLLNDTWLSIEVMNSLLLKRNLPQLSLQKYHEIFDFPVKDYYQKAGFDFSVEPFEIVGNEFIVEYDRRHLECHLHDNANKLLQHLKIIGIKQYVLSARNQHQLEIEFKHFEILDFFESFSGLSDNYANGKIELGFEMIKKNHIDIETTLMVGDTVHDFEVAQSLGIDSVLIAGGHHSKTRLESCNTTVLNNIQEVLILFNNLDILPV